MAHKLLFALALSALLAACASPAATPSPTSAPQAPQPTVAPTQPAPTVPPATAAPAPTTAPAPAGVLPTPLYLLQAGQVVRLETDGVTKTPLTAETPFAPGAIAIAELAVSPTDGALAYVLAGSGGNNSLVVTDAEGQGRRVLLENVPVAAPRWSPDGSAIAVQLFQPGAPDSPWTPGVWVVSAFSGEARQLLASDLAPADTSADAWLYAPDAWSPDGSKLLVGRFGQMVDGCDSAILDVNQGTLTTLRSTEDEVPAPLAQCAGGAWAPDSSGVYVVQRQVIPARPLPGLYLADASTGVMENVVLETTDDSRFILVQGQAAGPDGELLVLAAVVEQLPDPAAGPGAPLPPVTLYRVGPGSALEPLRDEQLALFGMPVWSPGGEGVLLPTQTDGGGVAYVYVPLSGEIVPLTIEPTAGIAWGR